MQKAPGVGKARNQRSLLKETILQTVQLHLNLRPLATCPDHKLE